MSSRERSHAAGIRRGIRLSAELSRAGLDGRLNLGLPRRVVARELRISPSKLQRWEHGQPPLPDVRRAAEWMSVLGLQLAVNVFPGGAPLRDEAHVRLIERFIALVSARVPRQFEAPIPQDRDQRAWDVLLVLGSSRVGVAAETRLRDAQALLRREQLKARDGRVDHLLFVLADTRANRVAEREARNILRSALPLDGRAIIPALRLGRDPRGSGLIFV